MENELVTEDDVQRALDFLRDTARPAAKCRADRVYLEQFRKSKKSLLRMESDAPTEAQRDDYAYTHPDYLKVLAGWRRVIQQDEEIRFLRVAAEAKIEAWRSWNANLRAMKI
jgi:hypothetical protein